MLAWSTETMTPTTVLPSGCNQNSALGRECGKHSSVSLAVGLAGLFVGATLFANPRNSVGFVVESVDAEFGVGKKAIDQRAAFG